MKYLLQQPKTLEDLTMTNLASWIALQAKKFLTPKWDLRRQDNATEADAELTRQTEKLRNHFSRHIPKKFQDTLASKIIKELIGLLETVQRQNESNKYGITDQAYKNQVKVIGRIIETAFTEQLSILSIDMDFHNFRYNMFREPLSSKSHMITGLVTLELKFKEVLNNYIKVEYELIQLLKNLHFLKHLTIHRACTDEILKCIAFNCNLIEDLDISYSGAVRDDGIKILHRLANLKSIDLFQTSVSSRGIETLLLTNKKLEEICFLIGCDRRMHYVLKQIAKSRDKPKFFKITTYKSNNDTCKQLKFVAKMCPHIINLYVRAGYTLRRGNVAAVTGFTNLRELTLVKYDFYTNKIKEVLQVIGRNLVNLTLARFKEVDLKALITISEMCPNLQRLSLLGCLLLATAPTSNTLKLSIQPLVNLKTLLFLSTFYGDRFSNLQYELTQEAVFLLLSKCPNIEFIELSKAWLTDELMMKVLDHNPMVHLRELTIREHHYDKEKDTITALVVDQIVQNCNNRPEVVLKADVIHYGNQIVESQSFRPRLQVITLSEGDPEYGMLFDD